MLRKFIIGAFAVAGMTAALMNPKTRPLVRRGVRYMMPHALRRRGWWH